MRASIVPVASAIAAWLVLASVASAQEHASPRPYSRELEREALTRCAGSPTPACAALLDARADASEWVLAGVLTATVGGPALVGAAFAAGFASERYGPACAGLSGLFSPCVPTTALIGHDDGLLALSITFAGAALVTVITGVVVALVGVSRARSLDYGVVVGPGTSLRVTPGNLIVEWI